MVNVRLQHLLDQIGEELRSVGSDLQRSATPSEILDLQEAAKRHLEVLPPQPYEHLLGITNGLSWGGVAIYGTTRAPIIGFPDRHISGFVESNMAFRASAPVFGNYLVFGDDGELLLSYSCQEKLFEVFTVFMTPIAQFRTFDEMICYIIEEQL